MPDIQVLFSAGERICSFPLTVRRIKGDRCKRTWYESTGWRARVAAAVRHLSVDYVGGLTFAISQLHFLQVAMLQFVAMHTVITATCNSVHIGPIYHQWFNATLISVHPTHQRPHKVLTSTPSHTHTMIRLPHVVQPHSSRTFLSHRTQHLTTLTNRHPARSRNIPLGPPLTLCNIASKLGGPVDQTAWWLELFDRRPGFRNACGKRCRAVC
jgi:hypothetical protein